MRPRWVGVAGPVPGGAAVSVDGPAGMHSGPPRGSRGAAMATPFGCPAGFPARNVGACRDAVGRGVGCVEGSPNCAAMGAVLGN
jgi:hypothetical protein